MSDEAFKILSRPRWNPRDLHSAAQRELQRGNRVANFVKAHRAKLQDPMTTDLAGWDEDLAKNSPWPWCFRCKTVVTGYGVEDRDKPVVTVVAECHGNKQAIRVERPSKDADERDPSWLQRIMRNLVFFAS